MPSRLARYPLLPRQHGFRKMSSTQFRSFGLVDWKAAAPRPLPGSLTFNAQTKLQKLPIPYLHDTLSRLKKSLKPIAWFDAEYAAVLKEIDNFANHQGPVLHNRLLERGNQLPHWLEEWWDDSAYLGYRDSVCASEILWFPTNNARLGRY